MMVSWRWLWTLTHVLYLPGSDINSLISNICVVILPFLSSHPALISPHCPPGIVKYWLKSKSIVLATVPWPFSDSVPEERRAVSSNLLIAPILTAGNYGFFSQVDTEPSLKDRAWPWLQVIIMHTLQNLPPFHKVPCPLLILCLPTFHFVKIPQRSLAVVYPSHLQIVWAC